MATVPHGVRSGEQFPVLVNNQQLMVTCPPGVRPGMQVSCTKKLNITKSDLRFASWFQPLAEAQV